ncbi:MAG: helix-turn-helix domain-containing protein [Acidobacteriia bacterium]|nr:helix-turn-helix domain-containing protein [Terriglobia bacterium]
MSKTQLDTAPNRNEKYLADYCQVSVESIRNWRRKKIGPAYTRLAGHMIRYSEADIAEWSASQRSV